MEEGEREGRREGGRGGEGYLSLFPTNTDLLVFAVDLVSVSSIS